MDTDWSNNMGDYNSRPLGEDDDLMELLWCNGHVVMQSQTNRKLPPRPEKTAPCVPAPAPAPAPAAAATAPEDEAGLWLPFAVPDSLDIFSDLFCEAPAAAAVKPPCERGVVVPPPEDDDRHGAVVSEAPPCGLMPLPKSTTPRVPWSRQQTVSLGDGDDLSELARAGNKAAGHQASSSTMLSAIGSSICGSNQVMVPRRAPDTALPSAVGSANASGRGSGHEAATVQASSSGRSNGCFGATTEPTSISNRSSKRKRLDSEDSESPSESESPAAAAARKPRTKMATARRSRAAEVHNVSERRRRDRINEKMRALQELIPHCNKTDKASMLDEAIEYLKSLQLQVQMMWMGSGIAAPPVMFPGVHQYLPRMPFMAPTPPVNTVPLPPAGYPRGHHMPALGVTEPYAHYLGVNHLHPGRGILPAGGEGRAAESSDSRAGWQQDRRRARGPARCSKQRTRITNNTRKDKLHGSAGEFSRTRTSCSSVLKD